MVGRPLSSEVLIESQANNISKYRIMHLKQNIPTPTYSGIRTRVETQSGTNRVQIEQLNVVWTW